MDELNNIAALLNDRFSTGEYSLPPGTLIPNMDYHFLLELENIDLYVGFVEHTIRVTTQQTPVITYLGLDDYNPVEPVEIPIEAILLDYCLDNIPSERGGGKRLLATTWTQDSSDNHLVANLTSYVQIYRGNQTLLFPSRVLHPEELYTFTAAATVRDSPSETSSLSITIHMKPAKLVAVVQGGGRSLGVENELVIDASGSYDEGDLDWTKSYESLTF